MSSTLLLPPRAQLCNRSCSNKTHTVSSSDERSMLHSKYSSSTCKMINVKIQDSWLPRLMAKGLFQAGAVNRADAERDRAKPRVLCLPIHHRLQRDSASEKEGSGMREPAHSAVIRTRSAPPQRHALVCVDGSCVGRRRYSCCDLQ